MAQQLVMTAPGKVGYEERAVGAPGPGQVRVKTILSGISHGTEMTVFTGTSPFIERKIIDGRVFVPKDAGDPPFYPFHWAGYDLAGKITAVGSGVTGYAVGDRVFIPRPHQTELLFAAADGEMLKLKPDTAPEDAIMTSLATVAFGAAQDAEIKLGDTVAVFGGGMVGQLTAQMAFLNGATTVFLVEPRADRRAQAAALMPVTPIDPAVKIPALAIRDRNGGRSPDVVIECSGSVPGLSGAIQAAGVAGTVVAAGFYAGPATALCLGEELLHNRVTIKASMGVWGCPSRWPLTWERVRELRTVLNLIEAKRLRFDGYVSLRVPFAEAQRAYETIRDNPKHTKVVLTYPA